MQSTGRQEQKLILNLGCGSDTRRDTINLDIRAFPGLDAVADAEKPLPFKDACFDKILALDVFEHLHDLPAVLAECARVLKKGGQLEIRGPSAEHPQLVWTDVTHLRGFTLHSFDHFDPDTSYGQRFQYSKAWKITDRGKEGQNLRFILERR